MSKLADLTFEPALVEGLKRGDRASAELIYRRLSGPVFTLAFPLLRDRQAALEATQDTFVDVIEKAVSLANGRSLAAWVRRIAVNHCLVRLRSPWHRRRENPIPGRNEPAAASLSLEDNRDLDVEGYTHREIGVLLGKTESFSKSQLARAHVRLVEWFDDAEQNGRFGKNGTHRVSE